MKVTTDACLFGAMIPDQIKNEELVINNLLDIGTGTALLSLMYAQKNPAATIDTIEIDMKAAVQAKENVQSSPWKERINIINDDARTFEFGKKYDLIISNPPFYEKEIKAGSSKKNIAHHNDGLVMEELLTIIKNTLKHTGIFFLLLPYKRNEEIKKLLTKNEFEILQMVFVKQSTQHDYFRIILTGKFKTDKLTEIELNEISIWDEKQQYTTEFVELLKNYYLHL